MSDFVWAFLTVSLYAAFQAAYGVWALWEVRFSLGGRRQRLGVWLRGVMAQKVNRLMEVWHG